MMACLRNPLILWWWLVSEILHCVMACFRNPALCDGLFHRSGIVWWWLISEILHCVKACFTDLALCGDGLFQKSHLVWWLVWEIPHCVIACVRNPALCDGLFQKSRIVWRLVWEILYCVIACFRNLALWGSRACGWCWSVACCPTSRLAGTPARGPSAKGWSTWTRHACGWGLGWCSVATVFDVLGELACTVCIWRCEHTRFCEEVFLRAVYKFSFIYHSCWSCIRRHMH